ncbi:TonB-dependent receptor domain-containing protein [Sphingobium sp. TomTYG45]
MSILLPTPPAIAQPGQTSRRYSIDAQPLGTALQLFARQSGIQILFAGKDVAGKRSRSLRGTISTAEALHRLIARTGLQPISISPTVIVLQRGGKTAEKPRRDPARPSSPKSSRPQSSEQIAFPPGDIVVTGSLVPQKPQPDLVSIITDETIAERAITSPSELARLITANSGSEAQVDQLNQPLTAGTAQLNLRNLGLGSTLILINGRRQTLSAVAAIDGSTFTDINSLMPLIALKRLEVAKDGAASTYGSDAVAGVANFITRGIEDGPEIRSRFNFMDGARQMDLGGIVGAKVASGELMIAGSYYESTRLAASERSFSRARTFGRPSWHSDSTFGQPGSYFRPSQQRFVPDPDCTNPRFSNSYVKGPTDPYCRFDFSEYYDLVPQESRTQLFSTYHVNILDSVNLNLELGYANTYLTVTSSPSYPILAVTPTVPAYHPDNPFGEDVLFRGRLLGSSFGPSTSTFDYDTFRTAGSLSGALGNNRRWTLDVTYSQQRVHYNKPDTIASALQNALNGLGGAGCDPLNSVSGVGPCLYYNPFGSAALGTGTINSTALIESMIGTTDLHGRASLLTIDSLLTGDAFSFAGVVAQGALGAQYRRSTFRHDWGPLVNAGELITLGKAPDFQGDQENVSIFGEVRLPLGRAIQAQLSGRFEKYLRSFSQFSPKLAFVFQPSAAILIHGSYSRAFRAPSVYQQIAVQDSQPAVNDSGTFVFVNAQTFGNRRLRPENATSYSLGATVRPIRGLELNVDFYSFDYKNLIVKEDPQSIVDQAAADTMAGYVNTAAQRRVVRDNNGTLSLIRLAFTNASSVKTQSVDVSMRYTGQSRIGDIELKAAATYVTKYDIHLSSGRRSVSGVSSVNFNNLARSLPKFRSDYSISLHSGLHKLTFLGHYVCAYTNDRTGISNAEIGAQHTFDVDYGVSLDKLLGRPGTQLSVGIVNLTDQAPPLAELNLGYDPIIHDPRGRMITVGLRAEL